MMKKGKLSEIKQGINCSLPELQSIDEKSLNQQVCENLQKFDTLPNILSVNNCKKIIIHLLNNYHPNVPTGLSCFLDDSTRFFETCFPEMREAVIREKRWLNFETPNRVSITHEYVIQLGKKPISNNLFYIFSPSHKLSWLKILINDERVPVANRDIVFEQIKIILDNEISSFVKLILSNLAKQKIFISIDEYNFRNLFQEIALSLLDHIPTFIRLPKNESTNENALVMTVTFFDSFSELLNNKTLRVPIFNLWEERELMYKVYPKTESATLWIYIKAPNNFHITSDEQIKNDQLPIVRDSEPDPEIATHRIVPKSLHGNQHPMFKINITIPKTLKVWLTTIIAISYITIIWVTICLFDKINLFSKIGIFPLTITNDFFSKNTSQEPLLSAILAMVAFILTARSWLIHEETVLAPISKKFSFLSLIFILLIIIVVIFFASY